MSNSPQRGLSLIELVVFIVVVSIGIAGIAVLYNQLTTSSVDPVVRKQAVAIAASLMEEIQLRAFTYCDPDDPAVYTATSTAGCATAEGIGAEGETRYADPRFDNVSDYHGFAMPAGDIRDITNNLISGLAGYAVQSVAITAGGLPDLLVADDALLISVTVTAPGNVTVTLQSYRLRYAPNSP